MNRILLLIRHAQILGVHRFINRLFHLVFYKLKGSIYPIPLPDIVVEQDLDLLLLELPPRYLPMMPNGLATVDNILKKCSAKYQILDVNILVYHQYHVARISEQKKIIEHEGYALPQDPWDNVAIQEWSQPELQAYFFTYLDRLFDQLAQKKPKALGVSVHAGNRNFILKFIGEARRRFPELVIIVGGYDCVYYETGPYLFPDFDYMVIGEAELSLPVLVEALTRGELPFDLPGIVSRYDTPERVWQSADLPLNLDTLGFPRYEFADLSLYRTFDGNHFVPVLGSRGCRWGRCTFCAECFLFRKRNPVSVVDEIEFMVSQGFSQFHFNDSDVNGDSQNLYDICSEIIRRKLKVSMLGQLRIDRKNTRPYFDHLKQAGFLHLRFGVDGWSPRTLRLQNKGYTIDMVHQNLKDCHDANIRVTVNVVIGVPGELENDIDEIIKNIIDSSKHIDLVEGINTLILAAGSEYFRYPEKFGIHFRSSKEVIFNRNPYFIPVEDWYSEEPYIDQEIRVDRLKRICAALLENKVNVGPFALNVINSLTKK